jgi:hypothetical protein
MIHPLASICQNYCMPATVSGVFAGVSHWILPRCTNELRGFKRDYRRAAISTHPYWSIAQSLADSHLAYVTACAFHMIYLQSLRRFMYGTYSKQRCLQLLSQIHTKISRCASATWQNNLRVSKNRFHFRQYQITQKTQAEKKNWTDNTSEASPRKSLAQLTQQMCRHNHEKQQNCCIWIHIK